MYYILNHLFFFHCFVMPSQSYIKFTYKCVFDFNFPLFHWPHLIFLYVSTTLFHSKEHYDKHFNFFIKVFIETFLVCKEVPSVFFLNYSSYS